VSPDEENPQTFSHVAFEVFLSRNRVAHTHRRKCGGYASGRAGHRLGLECSAADVTEDHTSAQADALYESRVPGHFVKHAGLERSRSAGCDKHREHLERVGGQDTGRLTRSKFIIRVPRMCCVMCTATLLEQFKEKLVEVCWRHQTRGDGDLCHCAIRQ
jgi:hypothetical protein